MKKENTEMTSQEAIQAFRQLKAEKAIKEMSLIKGVLEKNNAISISLRALEYVTEGIFHFALREPALVRSEKITEENRVIEFELGCFVLKPNKVVDFLSQKPGHLKITQAEKVYFESNNAEGEKVSLTPGTYCLMVVGREKLFIDIHL